MKRTRFGWGFWSVAVGMGLSVAVAAVVGAVTRFLALSLCERLDWAKRRLMARQTMPIVPAVK